MIRSRSMQVLFIAVMVLASTGGFAQQPKVGDPAPRFEGVDQDGKALTFPPKGSWAVLAFYPKAATPG